MKNNDLIINYGGILLDVDEQSIGGFDTSTLWDFGKEEVQGKGRSLDLSVPATKNNRKTLNFYDTIPGDGARRGLEGSVICGGVAIDGTIFVTGYSGGRYSLMIAYGRNFAGFGGGNYALQDTMTYNTQDVPATSGAIPNFGWYEYCNYFSPHATTGIIPALMPCTNIGHIITTMATAAGYTVNYPAVSLGRQYQADAYGLVLPSFGLRGVWHQVDVTGNAMNGYTATVVGGGTLADAGLEISQAFFKRGQVPQSVRINVFKTLRVVNVTLPANSGVVMCGGDGYIIYNNWEGTQGVTFRFRSGAVFALVNANEWHKAGKNNYWNRFELPPAYEGNITVSFQSNYGAFEFPQNGDTMYLAEALPQKTLEEWLNIYANLISGVWTADEFMKEITIKTYSELVTAAFGDAEHHIALENERVTGIDSVKRYIDGFAQHNYTRCVAGKNYPNRYTRDLRCQNDYLQEEKELSEIPITAGDQMGSSDQEVTRLLLDDVRHDDSGTFVYNGELALFFENNVTNDGARHIADTLDMDIGDDLQALVENGSSVSVRMLMPLFKFAKISELTCASLHGRNFVVQSAKWGKGVAQLQLLDIGEVLPQMSYNYINFLMPNGGDITLTRNGNPTPVTLEYSLDGGATWTTWSEVGGVRTLTLPAGGRVWLRNASSTSTGFSTGDSNYYNFAFTDSAYAYGDTRSLLCSRPFSGVLTAHVFRYLFSESSLVTAPELPAMSLAGSCYAYMFSGCSSLVTVPELPAMTLATGCYSWMFNRCSSLVTAPELPAMTLAQSCYDFMFSRCSSLVTAPVLPAMSLVNSCYAYMFALCTSLNNVTMLATDISATNCLRNWLSNVAATGTLRTDSRLTGIPVNSPSGIPTGWTREDVDPWLNFTMPNGGDITLTRNGNPTAVELEYSTDGGLNWSEWVEVNGVRTLTLQAGGRAYIRNTSALSTGFNLDTSNYYQFAFSDSVEADGSVDSLICVDPANAVITDSCYWWLFRDCATMTQAPRLTAAVLAPNCYRAMFLRCYGLTHAADMDAVTLSAYCCRAMYQNCTALAVGADCPATIAAEGCYYQMYLYCSSLSEVSTHLEDASAANCLYQWLRDVAATGDLYKKSVLSLPSGISGVPAGWTAHDTIV